MKTLCFLCVLLSSLSIRAAHVYFEFTDFISGPVSNKVIRITSLSTPGASGNTIVVTDQRRLSTAADGTLTVSNMVAGTYRIEPLASIWQIGAFNILVPDTNALLNANTLLTSTNTASANQAWTTSQSDARYVGKTNSWSSGQVMTGATAYASTITGGTVTNSAVYYPISTNGVLAGMVTSINFTRGITGHVSEGAAYLGTSEPVSIFSDLWNPLSDDTNTVGWWRSYAGVTYDASSNVTQVLDGSGFGRTMVQITAGDYPFFLTNGLTTGRASLKFDGTTDWLYATNFNLEQPCTLYLLWKNIGWAALDRVVNGMVPTAGAANNAFIFQNSSSPLVFQRTGGSTGASLSRQAVDTWAALVSTWNGASSTLFFNGFHAAGGNPGTGGFGGLVIGATELGAFNSNMEFGELIARVGIDDTDQILKTTRYIARQAGNPFNLLVVDGDSLTQGAGLGVSSLWSSQVVTNYLPTSAHWYQRNLAVGGDTTSNMLLRAYTTDTYYHPNNTTNIYCPWEVSQELALNFGTSVAFANYTNLCLGRKAAGFKVIAFTVVPRSNVVASFEADRLIVNAMIRSNYLSFADGLADVGNDGFLGCTLCNATNTYFLDGTHLTAAGHTVVANLVTNAISRIQQ